MAENTGRHLLAEKDFVKVVDAAGNELTDVPKHWDANLLPPGAEKKGRASSGSGSSSTPQRAEGEEPPRAGSGSGIAEWVKFATEKGATEDDLKDEKGEALTRDALIAKYGTPA